MSTFYTYDVESYPNFFSVTFMPVLRNKALLDAYIEQDILYINTPPEDTEERSRLLQLKDILRKELGIKVFLWWFNEDVYGDQILSSKEFDAFMVEHKIMYGYNSYNYDSNIIDTYLYKNQEYDYSTGYKIKEIGGKVIRDHITELLYRETCQWIDYGRAYKYDSACPLKYFKRPYEDRDLQKINYLDKSFTSLKQIAINLRWHRIQELPIAVGSTIAKSQIRTIIDYNINDVLITDALYWTCIEELKLRDEISDMYGMNFRNDSRSSIGNKLAMHYYAEATGLAIAQFANVNTFRYKVGMYEVLDLQRIYFKTAFFRDILDYIKTKEIHVSEESDDEDKAKGSKKTNRIYLDSATIDVPIDIKKDEFKRIEFIFDGTRYTLATGGLHSQDDPRIYSANSDISYIDLDVASFYPSIIYLFNVEPEHLKAGVFPKMVKGFRDDRVFAKRSGLKTKAEALKIVINRIYGSLLNKHDMNRDARALYQVTMNGQLALLMLVEMLYLKEFHVVSANTDGIVTEVPVDRLPIFKSIYKEWEELTGFELEETSYLRYIRRDVSNYLAEKTDGKLKYKGLFEPSITISKGFNHPIVTKAVNDYFIRNIPIDKTIREHIHSRPFAVYDYCMSQKVDKKFDVIYQTMQHGKLCKEVLQHANRFYVCDRMKGGQLFKQTKQKTISILKEQVILFNNYFAADDYHINYGYYIAQAEQVLWGTLKHNKKASQGGILDSQSTLF
jgi:hypothetical protein